MDGKFNRKNGETPEVFYPLLMWNPVLRRLSSIFGIGDLENE
jgi:hypothetical protein